MTDGKPDAWKGANKKQFREGVADIESTLKAGGLNVDDPKTITLKAFNKVVADNEAANATAAK